MCCDVVLLRLLLHVRRALVLELHGCTFGQCRDLDVSFIQRPSNVCVCVFMICVRANAERTCSKLSLELSVFTVRWNSLFSAVFMLKFVLKDVHNVRFGSEFQSSIYCSVCSWTRELRLKTLAFVRVTYFINVLWGRPISCKPFCSLCRVGIAGGGALGVQPPSSCLQTLIFEWKSALNFSYCAKFQIQKHFDIWLPSSFRVGFNIVYRVYYTSSASIYTLYCRLCWNSLI